MTPTWTKPYYGVQHLTSGIYHATVCAYDSFALLHCWYPGCGFSPTETKHETPEAARSAGEKWIRNINK